VRLVADFHRVKTPTPLEFPPPTTRPAARPSSWDWLVLYVARPLWGIRVELAAALALLAIWRWLASVLGRSIAALVVAAGVAGLLVIPEVRRRMLVVAHWARLRRRWATACRYSGLATTSDRIPRIVKHTLVPAGDRLLVRLPAGSFTAALAEAAEQVAVIMDVREVRVARDADRASLARVTVVRRDPLHGAPPLAWPWLEQARCSLWQPVPVGVDEDGHSVTITLPEHHVLLGGESGAGKSGGLALLLAAAALDPNVQLILFDGKLVELACWAGIADGSVGPDLAEAVAVLQEVQAELDRRLVTLLANRRRKLSPTLGLPLLLVVVDELAFYVAGPDRKLAAEFAARLRDLVARGRAAGVIVLAATQKPSHEIIPTGLRDLFGFRWAFRCLTPQASDTVLGSGWASLGHAASTIDAADRGIGLLLAEGGLPVRLRACWLDDDQLAVIAAHAEALRAHRPRDPLAVGGPVESDEDRRYGEGD
jgi:FtsK/SpoIIIE family